MIGEHLAQRIGHSMSPKATCTRNFAQIAHAVMVDHGAVCVFLLTSRDRLDDNRAQAHLGRFVKAWAGAAD
jgi:hypothetical protein